MVDVNHSSSSSDFMMSSSFKLGFMPVITGAVFRATLKIGTGAFLLLLGKGFSSGFIHFSLN